MGKEYYEFDNETNEIKPLEKDRKKKKAKGNNNHEPHQQQEPQAKQD